MLHLSMSSSLYNVWCAKLIPDQEGTELESLKVLLGLQSLDDTFMIPCASSTTSSCNFSQALGQNPNPPHGGRLGLSRVRAHNL